MAEDKKDDAPKQPSSQLGRSKDFRNVFANTFRVRTAVTDIGIAFGYATQIPGPGGSGERTIIQDEVEVILTPSALKLLKMAIDDNLEAIEKAIGTIKLPQDLLDFLAEQKAKVSNEL